MSGLVKWENGRVTNQSVTAVVQHNKSDPRHPINGGALVARNVCEMAVNEANAALVPAGEEAGRKQAEILLSAFPNRDHKDPEIYIRAMSAALSNCPKPIVEQVVVDVVMTHKFGLPPVAVVAERVRELMEPIISAKYTAETHLRAWERREAKEAEEQARREAARKWVEGLSDAEKADLEAVMKPGVVGMTKRVVKRPMPQRNHTHGQWTEDGWVPHGQSGMEARG